MFYGLKTKDGTKLYAVGSWEKLQHKVYTAYDKAICDRDDAWNHGTQEEIDRAEERFSQVEQAMDWVDNVKDDGLVYAPWDKRELILGIGIAYDCRADRLAALNR